jgi:hypothetical protein
MDEHGRVFGADLYLDMTTGPTTPRSCWTSCSAAAARSGPSMPTIVGRWSVNR